MLRSLLKGLRDIVYPKFCLVCKNKFKASSIDNLICLECWMNIKKNLPPFCLRCGRHLEANRSLKNLCIGCIRSMFHFDRAFSPCAYEGVIKDLIHEFKYKEKDYLGSTLSRLMIEFIKEYEIPMKYLDFIIPIPLHKTRLREREFNQAEILAKCIAGEFKKEVHTQFLKRNRPTRKQTDLEINERLLNVKESFSVNRIQDIKDKNILLVDDVLTTGATASWAAYALKEAGCNIVFVLTLAN